MEPSTTTITTAIVAALSAGAAAGVTDGAKKAVLDSYAALESAITERFGEKSAVAKAVEQFQAKPDSKGRQLTLGEEVEAAGASDATDVLEAARSLLATLEGHPGGEQHIQVAKGRFIAQADRSSTATVNVTSVESQDDRCDGARLFRVDEFSLRP